LDVLKETPSEAKRLYEENLEEYKILNAGLALIGARREAAAILYIHGPTGVGKTHTSMMTVDEMGYDLYKKSPGNQWFDGYMFEPVILFDEFTSCFTLQSFLAFCDPRPPKMQIKGGFVSITSPFVIITSNLSPNEQYTGDKVSSAQKDAFLSRVGYHYSDVCSRYHSFCLDLNGVRFVPSLKNVAKKKSAHPYEGETWNQRDKIKKVVSAFLRREWQFLHNYLKTDHAEKQGESSMTIEEANMMAEAMDTDYWLDAIE
jgi:hypothetical protein